MIRKILWSTVMVATGLLLYAAPSLAEGFDKEIFSRNPENHVLTGSSNPEFAFWFPRKAGNLRFGVILKDNSIWLDNLEQVSFHQSGNSYIWTLQDPLLGKGKIILTALSLTNADGIIIKAECTGTPSGTELLWVYGGASDTPFDISDAPLMPAQCFENKNTAEPFEFTLYYGQSTTLRVVIGIYPRQSEVRNVNPHVMNSPRALYQSGLHSTDQAIAGKIPNASSQAWYFTISGQNIPYYDTDLPKLFEQEQQKALAQ